MCEQWIKQYKQYIDDDLFGLTEEDKKKCKALINKIETHYNSLVEGKNETSMRWYYLEHPVK
jgi:hypothetical protein